MQIKNYDDDDLMGMLNDFSQDVVPQQTMKLHQQSNS